MKAASFSVRPREDLGAMDQSLAREHLSAAELDAWFDGNEDVGTFEVIDDRDGKEACGYGIATAGGAQGCECHRCLAEALLAGKAIVSPEPNAAVYAIAATEDDAWAAARKAVVALGDVADMLRATICVPATARALAAWPDAAAGKDPTCILRFGIVDVEDPATALRYRHATETEPGDERGLAKMLAQAAEDVRETNPALAVLFGFMAECPPEVACGLRQELRGLAPRLHPDTGERAVVARLLPTLDAWAAVLL